MPNVRLKRIALANQAVSVFMTPSPPPSSLSGRLARRAIDLLVIGFFGVVALSVGSQLIEWWRTDPESITPDLTGLAGVDLDWSRTPIAMQFGDASTSMERTPLQGDSDRLDEVLTKAAQSIVGSSQLPTAPPTHAEREWLTALETAPPVVWDSTLGNVYRRDEPLPSFVATRLVDAADHLAGEPIRRVVGWGLAVPTARGRISWPVPACSSACATPAALRPRSKMAKAAPCGSRQPGAATTGHKVKLPELLQDRSS